MTQGPAMIMGCIKYLIYYLKGPGRSVVDTYLHTYESTLPKPLKSQLYNFPSLPHVIIHLMEQIVCQLQIGNWAITTADE